MALVRVFDGSACKACLSESGAPAYSIALTVREC